jgi:hypothetical protein
MGMIQARLHLVANAGSLSRCLTAYYNVAGEFLRDPELNGMDVAVDHIDKQCFSSLGKTRKREMLGDIKR